METLQQRLGAGRAALAYDPKSGSILPSGVSLSTTFGRYSAKKCGTCLGSTPILAASASICSEPRALQISKTCRVSEHTVRAIRKREAQDIAERKKSLAVMLANVAELGAERMEQTIGKASLRDAVIATGVSVDKVALLTGPKMGLQVNIANIQPPTPEERRGATQGARAA